MMAKINITISGPVGCGKSAIAWLIDVALNARGLRVSYKDEATARIERNMTDGYRLDVFETQRPSIVLLEEIERPGEKPLNHDLLERALPMLIAEATSFTEASCNLDHDGTPVPGTCIAESVSDLEDYLQLIRDIESEIGPSETALEGWFDDLLNRRWSLTEKEGA